MRQPASNRQSQPRRKPADSGGGQGSAWHQTNVVLLDRAELQVAMAQKNKPADPGGGPQDRRHGVPEPSFPTARADAVPDGSFNGPYGIFADSVPARGGAGTRPGSCGCWPGPARTPSAPGARFAVQEDAAAVLSLTISARRLVIPIIASWSLWFSSSCIRCALSCASTNADCSSFPARYR
jgi:hypothetical protein